MIRARNERYYCRECDKEGKEELRIEFSFNSKDISMQIYIYRHECLNCEWKIAEVVVAR